jgi:hypothetical protein
MISIEYMVINKIAQDKLSLNEGLEWFDKLSFDEQREILLTTRFCLEQAIMDKENEDIEIIQKGIELIPLKPTMTAVVLLKSHPLKIALNKILLLPDNELKNAFISLVTLFKVADTKRRNMFCQNGCGHEWHNLDKYE